jgi:apolipoprotein N-acyltransferase
MTGPARRVGALRGARAAGLAALCGALLALAQPPLSWPFVIFLAAPPLLWLAQGAPGPRAAFLRGWAAGAGFFAAGLFWIVEPFLVDAARHGWMAPFALAGMAGGLALFWGAAFAGARALGREGVAGALALACLWTLAEAARATVLTGFPWALPAYAWIETPVMQAAAALGPHGLGFLTLVAGLLPGAALAGAGAGPALAAAALVAAGWGLGALRLAAPAPERAEPVVVRLVQPNAAQHLKWRPELQAEFFERHLAATRAPADPAPDVTIWSETAVPFVLGYAAELQAEAAAAASGGPLILGINRLEATPEAERWYNSLAVLGAGGAPLAVYDKHRLVPFGEYVPLGGPIARLGGPRIATLTARGFAAGPGPRLIGAPGLPPFLPLICYEAIFPWALRAPEGRAEWIVQVTNDAWFGTLAGPYQHLAQARARAIEQGLPLARAANTGVSAMIDPMGRVTAALRLGAAGHVDAALPAALPPTLYARWGDLPALLGVLAVLGLTVSNFRSSVSSRAPR